MKWYGVRLRFLTFVAFGLTAVVGSMYYWVKLGHLTIRPERTSMWNNAAQWWQGMQGRLLSHHRYGIQAALLDPETGRLQGVWDLRGDVEQLVERIHRVEAGQWLIVTLLEPWFTDEQRIQVENLLRAGGWSGDIRPANGGAGVFVLTAGPSGNDLVTIAGQVSQERELRLELSEWLPKAYGAALSRPLEIHVKPYD